MPRRAGRRARRWRTDRPPRVRQQPNRGRGDADDRTAVGSVVVRTKPRLPGAARRLAAPGRREVGRHDRRVGRRARFLDQRQHAGENRRRLPSPFPTATKSRASAVPRWIAQAAARDCCCCTSRTCRRGAISSCSVWSGARSQVGETRYGAARDPRRSTREWRSRHRGDRHHRDRVTRDARPAAYGHPRGSIHDVVDRPRCRARGVRYQHAGDEPPALTVDVRRFANAPVLAAVGERAIATTLITSEGRALTESRCGCAIAPRPS